jgi:AcrR family transcriptional regulator
MSRRTASGEGGRRHTRSSDDLASKRRSEILQAAIRVISHRGADHARLVDIADEAGVSVGLIQHYFRTRSALLSDVFGSAMDNSLKTFQAYAADDRSASEDVVQLCRILTREPFDEIFSLWLEFFSLSNRDRTFRARSGDIYERWSDLVHGVIEKGVEGGEFSPESPAYDVADRLVSLADGLGLRVLLRHPRMSKERMYDLLIRSVSRDLGVDLSAIEAPAAYRSV